MAPALFGDIKKKEEARDLDPSNGRSERNLCATSRRDCSTLLSFQEPVACISCDIIVLLFSCTEGYPCLWISSGHPRHAAMSAWAGFRFFVEMQLDSSLSLSLENAQRMFDGFTGEEIWSGAVLRRGYTKGVMDACFREQAVGSGESESSNAIWRGNKILGRLDSLLRKFLGSRLDFWKFLSLKNANNSGWTRGGRILNFAMDVRGVVGWFIEN